MNKIPDMLATVDQYTAWAAARNYTVPDNAQALLFAVTPQVLEATMGAMYQVDQSTGLAADATTAQALADATCAQAHAWATLGIDPATGGVIDAKGIVSSKRLGTASFEYAAATQAVQARQNALTGLVPAALGILHLHGLLHGQAVWR